MATQEVGTQGEILPLECSIPLCYHQSKAGRWLGERKMCHTSDLKQVQSELSPRRLQTVEEGVQLTMGGTTSMRGMDDVRPRQSGSNFLLTILR